MLLYREPPFAYPAQEAVHRFDYTLTFRLHAHRLQAEVHHSPSADKRTDHDTADRNGVLEAWAIVDRLRVLVDSKQAY